MRQEEVRKISPDHCQILQQQIMQISNAQTCFNTQKEYVVCLGLQGVSKVVPDPIQHFVEIETLAPVCITRDF